MGIAAELTSPPHGETGTLRAIDVDVKLRFVKQNVCHVPAFRVGAKKIA
jgi:hypothetical protein